MQAMTDNGNIFRRIADGTWNDVLDVLGPTVEFLTRPAAQGSFCVLRGVLPPGMTVPLHSHDDAEDFLVLAGPHQVLTQGTDGLEWADANTGDYVHIPAGMLHAHRNIADRTRQSISSSPPSGSGGSSPTWDGPSPVPRSRRPSATSSSSPPWPPGTATWMGTVRRERRGGHPDAQVRGRPITSPHHRPFVMENLI